MDSGWAVFVEGHENTEDKNIPSKRKQGLIKVHLIEEQKYDENDEKKKTGYSTETLARSALGHPG